MWDLNTGTAVGGVPHCGGDSYCLALHPNGDRFASLDGEGNLQTWSLPGCERLGDPMSGGAIDSVFSPDGASLLLRRSKEAVVLDAAKRQVRAKLAVASSFIWSRSTFFSDSRRALLGSPEGVLLWDTVSGEVLARYLSVNVAAVAVSPDGKRGFFGCDDQTVRVWDLEAAREVMSFSPHSGGVLSLAISKDGRTLLVGGWGGARDVTVHRALDWSKSPEQLRQEKLTRWRARLQADLGPTSKPTGSE